VLNCGIIFPFWWLSYSKHSISHCVGLSEFNLIQQSRLVLPSPLALPFLIALASFSAVASLLVMACLLVSAALLQGAFSQTETHMHGERVRRKIASKEGRASSVVAPRPLSGSLCRWEMGRMS